MRRMPLQLLLVALSAAAVGGAWWWTSSRGRAAESLDVSEFAQGSGQEARTHGSDASETPAVVPSPTAESGQDAEHTRLAVEATLRGRVQLEDSNRSATARVFGCALGIDSPASKPSAEWEAEVEALPATVIGQDGGFSFDPGSPKPARIFVVEPHHRLTWTDVSEGRTPALTAESATPVAVRVRRPENEEASEGATVFALYSVGPKQTEAEAGEENITLPCSYPVESPGPILIARGGDEVNLWAVAGTLRSPLWQGSLTEVDEVVLDLDATFTASGTVAGLESIDRSPSSLQVSCFRAAGEERRLLGRAYVDTRGAWRLEYLPTDETSALIFRLAGEGVTTLEKAHSAAPAGSELRVQFELEPPRGLSVLLVDFEDNPLPAVSLRASWMAESRIFSSPFETGDDGYGTLFEAPAGDIWIDVEKEGYSGGRFGPYALREEGEWRIRIPIGRAGRIVGRCVQGSKPAEEFTIRYWKDRPWNVQELRIVDSEDGGFVIEDAPLGLVQLLASSTDCPGSARHTVEVGPASEGWVEIELPVPGTAEGQVTDAATGAPVHDATIQVSTAATADDTWPWGEPFETNAVGEFAGIPVSEPLTMLEISAPGYAKVTRRAHAAPGRAFDCGVVELPRAQELTIQLVGGDVENYEQYSASVDADPSGVSKSFDVHGKAVIAKVSPGEVWITINTPHGSGIYLTARLYEGAEWRVEVPLQTGHDLTVEVRNEDGSPPGPGMWVGAAYAVADGTYAQLYQPLDGQGRSLILCVPTGTVELEILDSEFKHLARRSTTVDPVAPNVIEILLSPNERSLRFLDANGEALVSTEVIVALPGNSTPLGTTLITDNAGIATLRGFGPNTVLATVKLPVGVGNGIPIDLGVASDGPLEVVVDASATLDLAVFDHDMRLSGVWAQLKYEAGGPPIVTSLSDANGQVDFRPVTHGSYVVEVEAPGYWPAVMEVEARNDRPRFVMQVRRLGTLLVRAHRGAHPVAAASVDMVSEEFGERLSHWHAARKVMTSTSGLLTDAAGEFVIYGLPHGSYTWKAVAPGSAEAMGQIQVSPGDWTDLTLSFE